MSEHIDSKPREIEAARAAISRRRFLELSGLGAGAAMLYACGVGSSTTTFGAASPSGIFGDITAPFVPNGPVGTKPKLPRRHAGIYPVRVDAFLAVEEATRVACAKKDIDFVSGYFDLDETKFVNLIETFMNQGVGGMTVFGQFQEATLPLRQQLLASGVFLHGWVMPYVSQVVDFDQGGVGRTMANAALKFVKNNPNITGTPQAVIFTESDELLQTRWSEMRRVLKAGGVNIVYDAEIGFTPEQAQSAGATILQAHPNVNLWMCTTGQPAGLVNLYEAKGKKNDPSVAVFGLGPAQVDMDLIKPQDSVYRGACAAAYQLWGTAAGIYTADWLDGKTVPMGLKGINRMVSSAADVLKYSADTGDPWGTWNDPAKRDYYNPLYGNINYEHRTEVPTTHWVAPPDPAS